MSNGAQPVSPGIEVTEGLISAQTKVIGDDGILRSAKSDNTGVQKVNTQFSSGAVYENEDAGGDAAHNFTGVAAQLLLHDIIIQVSNNAVLIGNAANQRTEIAAGVSFGLTKIDLNTFRMKNKTAGQNAKLNIFATVV